MKYKFISFLIKIQNFISRHYIMKNIAVAGSPKQMSRLRNGHRVRVSGAMEGSGFNLLVDPAKFDQMSRSFSRGAAAQIQLSPEELMANKKAFMEGSMEGQGIFAGGKIKKLNKRLVSNVLKVAKKTGTTLGKPFEKTVQINPFTLGYDIGHDVIGPEVVHAFGRQTEEEYKRDQAKKKAAAAAGKGCKGGKVNVGKTLKKGFQKVGKTLAKAEEAVRENPTSRAIVKKVLPVVAKIAVTAAAQRAGLDPAATKELSNLGAQGTTAGLSEAGYGLYAGQGLYAGAHRGGSLLGPVSRMPEVGSLAIGGTLMSHTNPAMISDAMGANFAMNSQLPPQYQRGGVRFR